MSPQKKQPAEQPEQSDDIEIISIAEAARAIFERQDTNFVLSNGKVVEIEEARTRHFTYAVNFMDMLVEKLDGEKLHALVGAFAEAQRQAAAAGNDPRNIDVESVARAALGNASIVLKLVKHSSDELPQLVSVFTNLSAGEVEDLKVEELVVCILKVALANYSFFTQTLRPILETFVVAIMAKLQGRKVSLSV